MRRLSSLLSVRSVAALSVFVDRGALVMRFTHIGRDIIATGSDRRASRIAGSEHRRDRHRRVRGIRGLGGARRRVADYSLGAASPVALADVLAPAAAAAIVGGVSVVGGRGSPMGIAAGVLTLVHSAFRA